jgi:hypothetical protein
MTWFSLFAICLCFLSFITRDACRFPSCALITRVHATVRLGVLMAAVTVFWDMSPCSLVEIYLRFGGSYCPHLHNRRVRCVWKQRAEAPDIFTETLHGLPQYLHANSRVLPQIKARTAFFQLSPSHWHCVIWATYSFVKLTIEISLDRPVITFKPLNKTL